jgi:hypothetical protein
MSKCPKCGGTGWYQVEHAGVTYVGRCACSLEIKLAAATAERDVWRTYSEVLEETLIDQCPNIEDTNLWTHLQASKPPGESIVVALITERDALRHKVEVLERALGLLGNMADWCEDLPHGTCAKYPTCRECSLAQAEAELAAKSNPADWRDKVANVLDDTKEGAL